MNKNDILINYEFHINHVTSCMSYFKEAGRIWTKN